MPHVCFSAIIKHRLFVSLLGISSVFITQVFADSVIPSNQASHYDVNINLPDGQAEPDKFSLDFYKNYMITQDMQSAGKPMPNDFVAENYLSHYLANRMKYYWQDENGPGYDYYIRAQDYPPEWVSHINVSRLFSDFFPDLSHSIITLGDGCNKQRFLVNLTQEDKSWKILSIQLLDAENSGCYFSQDQDVMVEQENAPAFCRQLNHTAHAHRSWLKNNITRGETVISAGGPIAVYSAPETSCAIENGELNSGDKVSPYIEYQGFVAISYQSSGSGDKRGWILPSRLETTETDDYPIGEDEDTPSPYFRQTINTILSAIDRHHLTDGNDQCYSYRYKRHPESDNETISVIRDNNSAACKKENGESPQEPFDITIDIDSGKIVTNLALLKNAPVVLDTKYNPVSKSVIGSQRVYFYSSPSEADKLNSIFVIPDDKVMSYGTKDGFDFVNYVSKDHVISSGWMKSSSLREFIDSSKATAYTGEPLVAGDFYFRYHGVGAMLTGLTNNEWVLWLSSNQITATQDKTTGDVFSNVNFKGGSATLAPQDDIVRDRLIYSGYQGDRRQLYLSAITFNDSSIKTSRGLGVGDDVAEVVRRYGAGYEKISDQCIGYFYFDQRLSFCVDEKDKVKSIEFLSHYLPKTTGNDTN